PALATEPSSASTGPKNAAPRMASFFADRASFRLTVWAAPSSTCRRCPLPGEHVLVTHRNPAIALDVQGRGGVVSTDSWLPTAGWPIVGSLPRAAAHRGDARLPTGLTPDRADGIVGKSRSRKTTGPERPAADALTGGPSPHGLPPDLVPHLWRFRN